MKILILILPLILGCAPIIDYHKSHELELMHPCGGANDNNGIVWTIRGDFYAYPEEDIIKLEKKYSRWYPSINSQIMVAKGYGCPIPDKSVLAPGAMKEYKRLLSISRIKYVKSKDFPNQIMVTREYL